MLTVRKALNVGSNKWKAISTFHTIRYVANVSELSKMTQLYLSITDLIDLGDKQLPKHCGAQIFTNIIIEASQ
jgi:hypothetical protein